ncbi:MAG: (d)CMP kinase [Halobacteriota archaeon]|uniref:(d)CMP kinase n=1 Tax=Halodesulfurarchaeum sp. HSR-GB TaxID=3074077 RepID=UPI00285FF592|nr:AAA family ATPase [Halodesulfurarchaeum sp. HSR-GB]MDR5655720.1 AAA family ATPase [Halodesulfurarchaeum sp. HSR-GB]
MLITISGPIGSGKSTVATALAEARDFDHVSGGDIFRELAAERGYTPLEFNKLAEEDDQIDRDLDRRLREIAAERDDLVLESRLAGWMAGEHADLKFWFDAPEKIRAARVADREDRDFETALSELRARGESEAKRYQAYYGIDFTDHSIYDLSMNTARWDPEAVLAILETAIDAYDEATDEGAVPVTDVDYEF